MDSLLRELERQMTGPAGAYVRNLIAMGSRTLTPAEIAYFLTLILYETQNAEAILRFLSAAARAGLIDAEAVAAATARATQLLAEAEALAAGSAPGGAAGGAASAVLAAKLAALLAVAYMLYAIINEVVMTIPDVGPSGVPCGIGTPDGEYMRRLYRSITVFGFGQKTALKRALLQAEEISLVDAGRCKGNCPEGRSCKPTVAVDRVDISSSLFGTWVTLGFTTPCVCA